MKRHIFYRITLLALLSMSAISCGSRCCQVSEEINTPEDALKALIDGNRRFVENRRTHPNTGIRRLEETAPHQEPFAAIVGCSDSRVPLEVIFDRGVGDIFAIRTAGNNVGGVMTMGSVDYAVDHLGVKVLMVLGHKSCGGVTSAITPGEHHGHIGSLLHEIQHDIPQFVGKPELVDDAIHEHTLKQVEDILSNEMIRARVEDGSLLVIPAHYDIETGKVSINR